MNAADLAVGSVALVPDTVVYISLAAGRDTASVENLLARATQYHSAVALSELIQGVAHYDPRRPDYHEVRRQYRDLIRMIPGSRIITPDGDCWMRAGVIAGVLGRTQGLGRQQRKEIYADALIYLSATKLGLPVLTQDANHFALISQVQGGGRIIVF